MKRGAAVARGTVNAQVEGSNPSASAIPSYLRTRKCQIMCPLLDMEIKKI